METYVPDMPQECQLNLIRFVRCLNLELGFPLTGLEKMENVVSLPDFSTCFSDDDYISNQETQYQEHFASQIALRRLLVEFHGTLSRCRHPSFFPLRTLTFLSIHC